jgi:4-methylaminobutanoate oxidase (formaldehyde-forming)
MTIEPSPLPPLADRERLVDDTISAAAVIPTALETPPDRARVVVVGGGIIGTSVAHHLVENGISDVVLIERHRLTSGTTWHPAGLVATVRATHGLTELAGHSAAVYARLSERSGLEVGPAWRSASTVAAASRSRGARSGCPSSRTRWRWRGITASTRTR